MKSTKPSSRTITDSTKLDHFILGPYYEVIPATQDTWYKWFEDFKNRRIEYIEFDNTYISTVFLGCGGIFYESLLSTNIEELNDTILRAKTLQEALKNHNKLVEEYLTYKESHESNT